MKQEFNKYLLLLFTLMVAGCNSWQMSKPDSLVARSLAWTSIGDSDLSDIEGEFGLGFQYKHHRLQILTSESQGLLLVNSEGVASNLRASVELLDVRSGFISDDADSIVGISYDQDKRELFLFSVSHVNNAVVPELQELASFSVDEIEVDSVCMYQDGEQNLYAFMLDEQGNAAQYLLIDGVRKEIAPRNIRNFNVAPGGTACAVDDLSQRLFVLEENLGIWSYSAEPESDLNRKLFQLFKPYGKAIASATSMDVASGNLVVISAQEKELVVFTVAGAEIVERISLPDFVEPETVTLNQINAQASQFVFTVFDGGTDGYHLADIMLTAGNHVASETIKTVYPQVETQAMQMHGDVADDPAIWINPVAAGKSLVLATNKKSGLHVYDLEGKELQFMPTGRLNNVDVRSDFLIAENRVSIAAASNRSNNSISLYQIDNTSLVTFLGNIATGMSEVYGLCSYKDSLGKLNVFVNDKDGTMQQWLIEFDIKGNPAGKLVRQFKLESQPEGCVASDKSRRLFVGEEDVGIWALGAEADSRESLTRLLSVNEVDGSSPLYSDVEGVALYESDSSSYLIVSSQGNDSYLILDAKPPYNIRGRFKIVMNVVSGIDGASETDGLDVTSASLPGDFSEGFLVVQDGRNVMPKEGQNFKYVSWHRIKALLDLQ